MLPGVSEDRCAAKGSLEDRRCKPRGSSGIRDKRDAPIDGAHFRFGAWASTAMSRSLRVGKKGCGNPCEKRIRLMGHRLKSEAEPLSYFG